MRFEKKNGDNFEIQVDNLERAFKFVPKLDLNGNLSYNDLKDKPILPEGGIKTVEGELIEVPSKLSDLENDVGFLNASNGIANNLTINGLTSNGEFEIFGASPHIDFHFNNATDGYTSRIVEDSEGKLGILAPNGLFANGSKVQTKDDLQSIKLELSVYDNTLRDFNYTIKYVPVIPAVFVRFYGIFNKDLTNQTGGVQIIGFPESFLDKYKPNYQTALSVHSSKKITLAAKSNGIYVNVMDTGLKEFAVWAAGFWFV